MVIATEMATTIIMADVQALQRLLAWASPAFPVGAFAYSAGLEWAIAKHRVADAAQVRNWIEGNLKSGTARNDAILVGEAHRNHENPVRLAELSDLCLALTPSRQRHDEMLVTGSAFVDAARAWPSPVHDRLPSPCPYPVAFGAVAGASNVGVVDTSLAFLTAYCQAQISVAIRLVPIGQSDGLRIQAALEPLISELASGLADATTDDLGSAAIAADIAAMDHETLGTRIFRS